MPSTIPITTALRNACTELLSELGARAEEHAVEVEYHAISIWASSLLRTPDSLTAAAIAAQHGFSVCDVNAYWLSALDDLIQYGGEDVDSFMVTLGRFYLFNLPQVEEVLWQQYSSLRQKVILETGRHLPDSWGEWDGPMQAFMRLFAEHLSRENPHYGLLFGTPAARQLADVTPRPALLPGDVSMLAVLPAGDVDETAALTTYLEWYLERYSPLDAHGAQSGERYGLRLDDVFVPRRLCPANDWDEVRGYVRYQVATHRQGRIRQWPLTRIAHTMRDGNLSTSRPVTQVLDEVGRLLMVAGPGEGKTVLLRHLALQHASLILAELDESPPGQRLPGTPLLGPNHRLPLYLHVADYAENANIDEEGLLDYALRALGEEDLRDPGVPDVLCRLLEAGQVLFLLDGLDAVRGDDGRRRVAARISQLAAEWCAHPQDNRVLVACRPPGHQTAPLSPDFKTHLLTGLSRNEINEHLMRWSLTTERARRPMLADDALRRHAEQATIRVLREISTDDSLRAMAANPLLLRIMAESQGEQAYLSPQRAGLLRTAADAMIRDWRLARGPTRTSQVQEAEVTELLSHLAYWLHCHRSSGIASEREIAETLRRVWLEWHPEADHGTAREAIDDFLAKVRHHAGLLVEVRPRQYCFAHPSLQEYFAARYLVARYRLAVGRIRQHLHDPHWDEVVRLAIGFVALDSPSDASDLLESAILARPNGAGGESLPPSPFEDALKRDLLFAGSLLGDGVEVRPELTRHIVYQLVDMWLLGDRDGVGRFEAIFDQARQLLMAMDGTAAGQVALHYALTYANDERPHVRAFLADALTFWPSQVLVALETLVGLGRDELPLVRRAVAEALGRARTLTTKAHVLLLTMVSDTDNQVRKVARGALVSAGPVPDSAMRVWVRLLHDADAGKRQLGAKVLQRVGSLPPLVVGELLALLSDEEPKVRSAVANTLATLETLPDDALMAICRAINEAQPDVKVAAIEALARPVELPDEVLAHLTSWSQEPDALVRLAATRALDACYNTTDPVIDALMNRALDDALNVRQVAIEALGRKGAGNPRVAHMLLHFAVEPNPGVKISAAKALGFLEELSPEGESYLADLLQDFHLGVREAAMLSAARLGKPYRKVVQCLVDMTTDDDPHDVMRAGRTLTYITGLPTDALVALVGLLPAYPDELAGAIAACLHRHSPLTTEEVHPLMDLALGGPPQVRHLAIGVLGRSLHAVPGVMEVLLQLATDPDVDVRAEAIASLADARDITDRAIDELFGILDGQPLPVRQAAAVTLVKLSRTLPHLGWDVRRMEILTDRLYRLLREMPPRASWEPDADKQNAVFQALSWLATRYGPDV